MWVQFFLTISHDFHSSFTYEFNHLLCGQCHYTNENCKKRGHQNDCSDQTRLRVTSRGPDDQSIFIALAPLESAFHLLLPIPLPSLSLNSIHLIVVWKNISCFRPMRLLNNGYRSSEFKFAEGWENLRPGGVTTVDKDLVQRLNDGRQQTSVHVENIITI